MMGKILGVTLVCAYAICNLDYNVCGCCQYFNNNYTPSIAQNADNPMAKFVE